MCPKCKGTDFDVYATVSVRARIDRECNVVDSEELSGIEWEEDDVVVCRNGDCGLQMTSGEAHKADTERQ